LLNVTASADNQLTDINAKHATLDKDKTQPTSRDASMPQLVLEPTKSLVSETSRPAMHAELALLHTSQDQTDQSATDQDQLAHALRNTLLMDTAAFHAPMVKLLMMLETNATKLLNAMDQERFLEPDKTATDATLAQQTLFQTIPELPVLDQSQSAHVLKDTLLMDMTALNAQIDKLLTQTTTRDASHNNAMLETKSSQPENTATDAILAQQDINQTHKEPSASESSQSAAALRSMTQVDTSVFHAHHGKLPPTETKDVSQDNAQDSMRFSELKILAMHARNAKRDLLQTISEEDA
jgi:hypothetical protein